MAETTTALKQECFSFVKSTQVAYLATVEDRQPRTRPVTVLWHNGCAWIGSGTSNGKTLQVRRNSNVEVCIPIERGDRHGYVRLAGTAEIITDPGVRAEISEKMPFFDAFWEGSDDPRYTLIRITPSEILYLRPEENHHHTIYL